MFRTVGEPLARKQAPRTAYEAKFSAPYAVASALIGGSGLGLGVKDFSGELLEDPTRRALVLRISVAKSRVHQRRIATISRQVSGRVRFQLWPLAERRYSTLWSWPRDLWQ
jgi:2-methylcitrate dehydratase PrpD